MSAGSFIFGDRVTIVSGTYAGLTGVVVDPATDSDLLPTPLPGHCWIRVMLENISVPLHVPETGMKRAP